MIKRKGTITRIVHVEDGGNILRVGNMHATRELTAPVVGNKNIPLSDYRVTYSISPKGNLKCYTHFNEGVIRIKNNKRRGNRVVCWLPRYFIGQKLIRTVEIIKKGVEHGKSNPS